jgi:deoxyribodipyrimidine photolyase-like uncharacterized protein
VTLVRASLRHHGERNRREFLRVHYRTVSPWSQSWEELCQRAKQLSGSVVTVTGQLDLSAEMVLKPMACNLGGCCHQFGALNYR